MKEEALARTLWRICFGISYRPVVREIKNYIFFNIRYIETVIVKATRSLCKSHCNERNLSHFSSILRCRGLFFVVKGPAAEATGAPQH